MGWPPVEPTNTLKFLCSYGGKIVPRYPDGKLRYHGGHTRVLSVPRSISFPELMIKMGELCGTRVSIRCQLPTEDLDALISIKSDEDLSNLIEEYDHFSSIKVRVFLSPKNSNPPTFSRSPSESPKSLSPSSSFSSPRFSSPVTAISYAIPGSGKTAGCHHCCHNSSHMYLIHNGNHWQ